MPIDPFQLKTLSKAHPKRLGYVAWSRYHDWKARRQFARNALPLRARADWSFGRTVSLVFIDAVHDYVNTRFDIGAWLPLVVAGGIIALHDVDQIQFAGTRRAAAELASGYPLFAHVDNLVAVQLP